jgi:hypothetical protein
MNILESGNKCLEINIFQYSSKQQQKQGLPMPNRP